MPCISPLLLNPRTTRDVVPCGKCNYCLQTKRADWTFRLLQEVKQCTSAHFLTLTYADEFIPISEHGEYQLDKVDTQLFMKRLRKENTEPLRYYTVGEYGTETDRPHYHSIMFNLDARLYGNLERIWKKGMVHFGTVNIASIHYVTKYVINRHGDYSGREPPFALMSRRPGIGARYLNTHTKWHQQNQANYVNVNGIKGRLPRYYKDKLFDSDARSVMAADAIALSDQRYREEITRLSKFCDDPYAYYDYRNGYNHDAITSKVNALNKF